MPGPTAPPCRLERSGYALPASVQCARGWWSMCVRSAGRNAVLNVVTLAERRIPYATNVSMLAMRTGTGNPAMGSGITSALSHRAEKGKPMERTNAETRTDTRTDGAPRLAGGLGLSCRRCIHLRRSKEDARRFICRWLGGVWREPSQQRCQHGYKDDSRPERLVEVR